MNEILPYEYACALKDAGYPQPYFTEGRYWYTIDTALIYDVQAHGKLRRPKKAGLAYAPGYEELAEATNTAISEKYSIQELANIWLAQNKKR